MGKAHNGLAAKHGTAGPRLPKAISMGRYEVKMRMNPMQGIICRRFLGASYQNFAARRVQAGVWVLRASQVAIRDDADIMSGRRKLRPRDKEGWRVPRPGAISAEIYACAKEGMRTIEIASAVGRKRSTVAVHLFKIKHPERPKR
jgi:hypothetical protein